MEKPHRCNGELSHKYDRLAQLDLPSLIQTCTK